MTVTIGGRPVGAVAPYVIAEIGINHNGSLDITKRLIDTAFVAGCDAVKFQMRTVEAVYTPEELAAPRVSPFGETNGDLKRALEYSLADYQEIDRYCASKPIHWSASPWDIESVHRLAQFCPPWVKVASASLTDDALLRVIRGYRWPVILSTGMSSVEEIDHAVEVLGTQDLILLHCCSAYPAEYDDINLRAMQTLRERYGVPVGYSGHETGLPSSLAAAAMGAVVIERHITMDRAMWGSDHAASLGPHGIMRLVEDIRLVTRAMGDGAIGIRPAEEAVKAKLRRVK